MYGPITDDLADMFIDELIVEPFISSDSYGEPIYGAPRKIPARVIGRTKMAMGADGREQVSNAQAMLPGEYGITTDDRYTIPQRFSANPRDTSDLFSRQPKAIAVDRSTDENGPHHTVVYFSVQRVRGF